jgi:hypothetical protein
MTRNSTMISESLHLNIEQRVDFLFEQEIVSTVTNRVKISAQKQLSISISKVYVEEKSFTPPLHNV